MSPVRNFIFVIVLSYVQIIQTETARILFVAQSPSVSHQKVFQPIWKELSLRGHHVYVITPNPLKDPNLTNLTEIDISSVYELKDSALSKDMAKYILKKPDMLEVFIKYHFLTKGYNELNEYYFSHENIQKFLSQEHHFDITVVEWIFPTMAGFAAKYRTPLVGITSLGAPTVSLDAVGNPSHPLIAPDYSLPIGNDMTFRERFMSSLYAVYVRIYYHLLVLSREDELVKKYLGDDLPYLGDIERNISILLLNRNPVLHRVIPVMPTVIEFGGMKTQAAEPKDLSEGLADFLDQAKEGFVYFSLGSNLKSIHLSDNQVKILFKAFSNLPFRVLWKWEGDNFPYKAKNIFTQKWLPQESVLAHPNIKLFITQGGLQSIEEAINHHIPIIGIPSHGDQTSNVDACVKHGMGRLIDLEDISVQKLNDTIFEIIKNKSFQEKAIYLEKLLHDQPTDGLQRAVWWIEYVIRHKGAKHLRSPALDISWCQYLLLDIIAVLTVTLAFFIYVIYKLLTLLLSCVNKLSRYTRGEMKLCHEKSQ